MQRSHPIRKITLDLMDLYQIFAEKVLYSPDFDGFHSWVNGRVLEEKTHQPTCRRLFLRSGGQPPEKLVRLWSILLGGGGEEEWVDSPNGEFDEECNSFSHFFVLFYTPQIINCHIFFYFPYNQLFFIKLLGKYCGIFFTVRFNFLEHFS